MRIGDVLYFSPQYRFEDLNVDDAETMLAALRDRLIGFYLTPASRLAESNDAFAAGLLCCAAIDFVALCAGEEPEAWLIKNIPAFADENLAKQFWRRFRHGLMHEGRVKAFGEFSLDLPDLATVEGPALIINPKRLQEGDAGRVHDLSQKPQRAWYRDIAETTTKVLSGRNRTCREVNTIGKMMSTRYLRLRGRAPTRWQTEVTTLNSPPSAGQPVPTPTLE